jgi:hypothetical protein
MMRAKAVRPAQLALAHAEQRLVARLAQLETKIAAGDESAWCEYAQLAAALAVVAPLTIPGAERALSTHELATAFGLTPRTARRHGLKGLLPVAPIRTGPGTRAKLRWSAR